jgi:hypothetical protein
MIAISNETQSAALRWLERCTHQLVAYIPDEDRAELSLIIAELKNAAPVPDAHEAQAPRTAAEMYPDPWISAMIHWNPKTGEVQSDGDHTLRHWITGMQVALGSHPVKHSLDMILDALKCKAGAPSSPDPDNQPTCTPVYPCPKCGKDHAIALPIPFSWGCDCGCKFGVDYGISKTGRRCWVHTGVLDLRAEATT